MEAPPPPPDPNQNPWGLKGGCQTSPRPSLRRSKTLPNPDLTPSWRREPLEDVTNLVLGGNPLNREGRLQRVPPPIFTAPTPTASTTFSPQNSPHTPARYPRRLRRTQSEATATSSPIPSPLATGEPTTPLNSDELRRARRRSFGGDSPSRRLGVDQEDAGGPAVQTIGMRRTRSTLPSVAEDEGSDGASQDDTARRLRRRRTTGGKSEKTGSFR